MKVDTDPQKINEVLTRGVECIYPSPEALKSVLAGGRKLRIYLGIDPTGKLHIGHLAGLRKLRQLQDLGHEIIVLLGDFTATIGDPTDKTATRQPLTREEVRKNEKGYKKQIGKILDLTKANVRFFSNEKWTNKLKPKDMLELASRFTVARLLERDMFQERIKAGKDIRVHEFLYPIFQAYDGVTMDVDMEIGGNDQTFNMLAGRDLMRTMKNKEKFVLATRLLVDPSGKKMGKTEGNMVNLDESPNEMFGKIMSWPDGLVAMGLELLTNVSQGGIEEIKKLNPREAKVRLAKEIVATCHSQELASLAEKEFNRVFQKKEQPTKIPKISLREKELSLVELIVKTKLASSKSEARRLVLQKGIKIDGKVQSDPAEIIVIKKGTVIQAGPRRFVRMQ